MPSGARSLTRTGHDESVRLTIPMLVLKSVLPHSCEINPVSA